MQPISQTIDALRQKHGDSLLILAHHYQKDSVVAHADLTGDSLELAKQIPLAKKARNIVFCGVHFMAESAAILATPDQHVFLPAANAGCVMSNMAPAELVEAVLIKLNSGKRKVIPLAYVNSSAAVKGICGKFGGSVCTSANSSTMMRWALEQGDAVLFLPDQNLGLNTADLLGMPQDERLRINVRQKGTLVDLAAAEQAKLILWPGCCAVHHLFKTSHIDKMRQKHPNAQIIVHPECSPEVVKKADAAGSTSAIIKFVETAPTGATLIVGTEISLVDRLTERYAPDKKIVPLARCQCSNMVKTTEEKLLNTLNALQTGRDISVKDTVRTPARLALQRMLDACN